MAGVFTDSALDQLRSLDFSVVYSSYDSVIEAFGRVGIDAFTNEDTPDHKVAEKVAQWQQLPRNKQRVVSDTLLELNDFKIDGFFSALGESISRRIQEIIILPLHGTMCETTSIHEAVSILEAYDETLSQSRFERYEIHIRFSNMDEIVGKFNNKLSAIDFLKRY